MFAFWSAVAWSAGVVVPEAAAELIACDDRSQLEDLRVLDAIPDTVPATGPFVLFLEGSLHALAGDSPAGPSTALLDRIDTSSPGCWVWHRTPEGLMHMTPDLTRIDSWLARDAVNGLARLTPEFLDASVQSPTAPTPRTTWVPDVLMRYNTARAPDGGVEGEPALTCEPWAAGTTFATDGIAAALWCPMDKAKKALKALTKQVDEAEESDDVWNLGPEATLQYAAVLPGALLLGSDRTLMLDAIDGRGSPWWPDEVDSSVAGVFRQKQTPEGAIRFLVRPDGALYNVQVDATPDFLRSTLATQPRPASTPPAASVPE